jgi:hypothetical protein
MAIGEYLSGEFILTGPPRRANGSGVILCRTIIVSFILYIMALLLRAALDPPICMTLSMDAPRCVATNTLPWFGAIFVAVYATLYTRFSSQWTYLAGLYNQIKATEAQIAVAADKSAAEDVLASWKAGFIEDAEELHLALKPMFAALIQTWSQDPMVQDKFDKDTPGQRARLDRLLKEVDQVLEKHERNYEQKFLARGNILQRHISKWVLSLSPRGQRIFCEIVLWGSLFGMAFGFAFPLTGLTWVVCFYFKVTLSIQAAGYICLAWASLYILLSFGLALYSRIVHGTWVPPS